MINFKPLKYSVNSLYNKCEILKFGDNIRVICQQPCVRVLHFWIVNTQITRNQEGNQVNIPTLRTKTSGSNSIKSKYVNTCNDLNKL